MWFWKKQAAKPVPCPGLKLAVDGHGALAAVEQQLSDTIAVRSTPYFADLVDQLSRQNTTIHIRKDIRPAGQLTELAAITAGSALTGLRTAAITDRLGGLSEELYAMAGMRLACVFHLTCRAIARQAGAMHGGHDDYHNAAGAGFFQLFAGNAQEVADFTVIAHRIAELSLTPGIVAQDFYQTSHSIQNIQLPETELLQKFLGTPDDMIASPTPAQALLFGEQRRRIPILLDRDHPAAIGVSQDRESFFRATAAQRPFFYDHLQPIIDAALAGYAELTGRAYAPAATYRAEDAEYLILAQGTISEELQAAVDFLRQRDGLRAGIIKLNLLRPFPGALLSHLLHGRKAVTVLERTDQPLAEDPPLLRELRAALDKALENGGAAGKTLPWPAYKSYRRISDRPVLYAGCYGVGSYLPGVADLAAVFRNMLDAGKGKKSFYVGRLFVEPDRRFPHLQALQQQLQRDYPQLHQLSVHAGSERPDLPVTCSSAEFQYLSSQGGIFAVNLYARALAAALPGQFRTFPRGGLEENLHPASIILACGRGDNAITGRPVANDILLTTSWRLVENPSLLETVRSGGRLIIVSNRTPETLRRDLSRRVQKLLLDRSIRVAVVDARRIAADTASNPAFVDQLSVWALLGIHLAIHPDWSDGEREAIRAQLSALLDLSIAAGRPRITEITQIMARAPEALIEIPQEFWEYYTQSEVGEPEPPWTVKQTTTREHQVHDGTRFWHSVGYLYDSGQYDHTLGDPYLATGIVPAATSAFRDITPYRLRLPEWLPENCTGCGICWAVCPETALPPLVLDLPALLLGAVACCEAAGNTFIQLKRILEPLAKLAYRLLLKDELGQYHSLDPLLRDAFKQTSEQLKLDAEKQGQLDTEFGQVHARLEHLPLARTGTFFVEPHQREKNSGMLLSITLNPMTCTGCGICVASCPDRAFQWDDSAPEKINILKQNWQLQLELPGPGPQRIQQFVTAQQPQTQVHRLLDRKAYHTMLGGEGTRIGNGAKTALHLLTATAEAIMRARFERHAEQLQQWITGLEALIQGDVSGTLNINDFDDFTRRLSRLDGSQLSADTLADLVSDRRRKPDIDQVKLQRQSELLIRLKLQLQRYRQGLDGNGRARMFLVIDPGAASCWSETYPYNPHTQPWVCFPSANVTGLAEGIARGISRAVTEDFKLCRQAGLELSGAYSSERYAQEAAALDQGDLSKAEKQLVPPVFVICRADDIHQDLNRLVPGAYPLKLAVINQQGLTVTGPDNTVYFQDLPAVMQKQVLIAQASVGHPGDLVSGIAAMVEHDGPALLHVYAPDPAISGVAQEQIIEHAALAYRSRAFPLYRIEPQDHGTAVVLGTNPEPDRDWYHREQTVRDHSGVESQLASCITVADWAVREARFQQHFEILPKGHLNEEMKPLADYLDLEPGNRESYRPYIDFINDRQQHFIATVSAAMVTACTAARDGWRELQAVAAGTTVPVTPQAPQETAAAGTTAQPQPAADLSAHDKLTERLLELCGYSQDPDFFKKSLRDFLTSGDQPVDAQPEATD